MIINDNYLIALLKSLDCGSNSCKFAADKKGQRTNSGCRCLPTYPSEQRLAVEKLWHKYKTDSEGE